MEMRFLGIMFFAIVVTLSERLADYTSFTIFLTDRYALAATQVPFSSGGNALFLMAA